MTESEYQLMETGMHSLSPLSAWTDVWQTQLLPVSLFFLAFIWYIDELDWIWRGAGRQSGATRRNPFDHLSHHPPLFPKPYHPSSESIAKLKESSHQKDSDPGRVRFFRVQKAIMIIQTIVTQSKEIPQTTPTNHLNLKLPTAGESTSPLAIQWTRITNHNRNLCLVPVLNFSFHSAQHTTGFGICKALYWDE